MDTQPFLPNQIAYLPLAEEDRQFLLTVGLPTGAIPFLGFENSPENHLYTIPAIWGLPETLKVQLEHYYQFGEDGGGNPTSLRWP